jgi:hypothetical protein
MIAKFQYQPPSFLEIEDARLKHETDKAVKTLASAHANLVQTAIQAPVQGTAFQVVGGQQTVTGSKLLLATGLSKVTSVTASVDNGAAASAYTVTARISPSNLTKIDLFVWQPTGAAVTTPIAATAPVTIHWWAVGESLVAAA